MDSHRSHAIVVMLATLVLAAVRPAEAGQDVLWDIPYPSASVYGTSYSTVYDSQFPNDTEVGDDIEATGVIESLFVPGRGCGQCTPPIVEGVFVRLYEWTSAGPGPLQQEVYVPAGDGFTWGGSYPYFLDITLPEPIPVNGWHFLSVQVAYGSTGGIWNFVQANRFNPINMPVHFRDNLEDGIWEQDHFFSTPIEADVAMTLYGQAGATTPVVETVSDTAFRASDRIRVTGSGFGAPGNGELRVNGLPALVTTWSSTEIVGYAPEGIVPGPGALTVVNLDVESDPLPVTVLPREPNGRVLWVFEGDGDYASFPPGIGPDGTLYFSDIDGNLYAMSPDGGLLWIADALLGQQGNADEAPVTVGADGTIYVGTNPLGPTVELVAFEPDGTPKWSFTVPQGLTWQAGPTLGPDGRIYGSVNAGQLLGGAYDVLAVEPDGTLAWSTAADPFVWESSAPGSEMVFGPTSPGGPLEQLLFTADGNGNGRNWGFDIADGDQRFATPTNGGNDVGQTQLAVDPATGDFYMMEFTGLGGLGWGLQAFDPQGGRTWRFDPGIASGATHPAVGPDGTIYFGWDLGRLSAATPGGSEIWTFFQPVIYNHPVPSPVDPLLLAVGKESFNEPAFMEGRHTADGALLWSQPLVDDAGADVSPDSKPRFTAAGDVAYFTALELPITPTSTFRVFAVDTSSGDPAVPGDVDGDGAVSVQDLIEVITAWGDCAACDACPADLDGNCVVDVQDLVTVLLNWS